MRYGQLVVGPAGSGKSTYCAAIVKHAQATRRTIHVVNLDPAAENFDYEPIAGASPSKIMSKSIDIRTLVSVDDAMDAYDTQLGPNGGLLFCMEHLGTHMEWLETAIGDIDQDYILFDCPGQIELYTHQPVMRKIVETLQSWDIRLCTVFILDTQFMLEIPKFFSGALVALSAMVGLETPCVNVLSKMDLLNAENRRVIEAYLIPQASQLLDAFENEPGDKAWNAKHRTLSRAIAGLLDDYSLLKFTPLDLTDEENISDVLLSIDMSIQYGEDEEVRDRYPEEVDEQP